MPLRIHSPQFFGTGVGVERVLVEMWHLSCRLNLHVDGYILEKAHLIRGMIYSLAFMYHLAY